eukprot:TRINITY_DN10760_c0_g1_i3.p1 TRINITY_DN10760_c0_g1~~TRINITY_DN10760_c0_g1_i3.p1  ORF type:complete len:113 (+),score=0.88 TRINITY_DN10760_c0_g1_i3:222-560(+)
MLSTRASRLAQLKLPRELHLPIHSPVHLASVALKRVLGVFSNHRSHNLTPDEALVVGGGVTGLTTALLLRRAGIGAHIVERASRPDGISGLYVICPVALSKLNLQFPGVGGL